MELIGYFASILIGVSLGLIGGGGSILTVPVLVYLFAQPPIEATLYSLFIVGLSSAIGAVTYLKSKLVKVKNALAFAVPSIASILFTRNFILPNLPDVLFSVGDFALTKSTFLLIVFAVLMILASIKMIVPSSLKADTAQSENLAMLALNGFGVGFITGLIGVGGGFLIIPSLVILAKLDMKEAVGTSLFIIALNSLIGFFGSLRGVEADWLFLLSISTLAIVGMFIGTSLARRIDGSRLKPMFGWFVLVMGVFVLLKETVLKTL
ncbi:MAG: sulfite exporter TauE/SafE family protein [Chloroherpetonaceae bacterium]